MYVCLVLDKLEKATVYEGISFFFVVAVGFFCILRES